MSEKWGRFGADLGQIFKLKMPYSYDMNPES